MQLVVEQLELEAVEHREEAVVVQLVVVVEQLEVVERLKEVG